MPVYLNDDSTSETHHEKITLKGKVKQETKACTTNKDEYVDCDAEDSLSQETEETDYEDVELVLEKNGNSRPSQCEYRLKRRRRLSYLQAQVDFQVIFRKVARRMYKGQKELEIQMAPKKIQRSDVINILQLLSDFKR